MIARGTRALRPIIASGRDLIAPIVHATDLTVPPGATFPEWAAAFLLHFGIRLIR